MTEEDARAWIRARHGGEAIERITAFFAMVVEENDRQNLVAPSTIGLMWVRHGLDSAQLVGMGRPGRWIDVGTGGGFPGMVVAMLRSDETIMVEPRRRRAAFLQHCVDRLAIKGARVLAERIEVVDTLADTISARAVAPIEKLVMIARGSASSGTRWLLPRGTLSSDDAGYLDRRWRGMFHVEQSLTDAGSSILLLEGLPSA